MIKVAGFLLCAVIATGCSTPESTTPHESAPKSLAVRDQECDSLQARVEKSAGGHLDTKTRLTKSQFDATLSLFEQFPSKSEADIKKTIAAFESGSTTKDVADYLATAQDCAFLRLRVSRALLEADVDGARQARAKEAVRAQIQKPRVPTLMNSAIDISLLNSALTLKLSKADQLKLASVAEESKQARDKSKAYWDQMPKGYQGFSDELTPDELTKVRAELKSEIATYNSLKPRISELAAKL